MVDYKKHWKNLSADERKELYFIYKKEKKSDACCDIVIEAFFKHKKKAMPKIASKFKLKAGTVIDHPSGIGHVTNENLTDELALQILQDERKKKHFDVIPDVIPGAVETKHQEENLAPEKPKQYQKKQSRGK